MDKNTRKANKSYEDFFEGFSKILGTTNLGIYAMPSVAKRENLTRLSGPPYREGSVSGVFAGSVAAGFALGLQLTSYFLPEFNSVGYEALEPLAWSNGVSTAFETGESVYKSFMGRNFSSSHNLSNGSGGLEKKTR